MDVCTPYEHPLYLVQTNEMINVEDHHTLLDMALSQTWEACDKDRPNEAART